MQFSDRHFLHMTHDTFMTQNNSIFVIQKHAMRLMAGEALASFLSDLPTF